MECPRCRSALEVIELRGGPYRGAPVSDGVARCHRCAITLVDASRLGLTVPKQAGYVSIERSRKAVSEGCPRCLTSLEKVYVEYEEVAVEYEECARCSLLVLDDGEIGALRAIAAAARGVEDAPAMVSTEHEPSAGEQVVDELVALFGLLAGAAPGRRPPPV